EPSARAAAKAMRRLHMTASLELADAGREQRPRRRYNQYYVIRPRQPKTNAELSTLDGSVPRDPIDLCELIGTKLPAGRVGVLANWLGRARPGDPAGDLGLGQEPAECELQERAAARRAERVQPLDDAQVRVVEDAVGVARIGEARPGRQRTAEPVLPAQHT